MSTIKLFKKAFSGKEVDFKKMNVEAMKRGYIIHQDCCTNEVLNFINSLNVDYNNTFYKSFSDVTSKTREELWLDQIAHYASTYGTGFTSEAFTKNENPYQPEFEKFEVILPITEDEALDRCAKMLYSGIALNGDTLNYIFDVLAVIPNSLKRIDLSKIKNKECLMQFHLKFGTLPTDSAEFVRFLVFVATGSTLLIKDKKTIQAVKNSAVDISEYLETFGLEKLAVSFNRFKNILLGFKYNSKNAVLINKIGRLSKTLHKPFKVGFFEQVLSNPKLIPDLEKNIEQVSNFKKVNLLETISRRKANFDMRFFMVRNGKIWAKEQKLKPTNYLDVIYSIIYNSLIKSLSKKAKNVILPQGVNLTLPTSEKSFIGNYPLGTSFDLFDNDTIVGINWHKDGGATDLDLSYIDDNGEIISWNRSYYSKDNDVIFSGDVTYPDPSATELMYVGGKTNSLNGAILQVATYYGCTPNAKFTFFLANEKITEMQRNYMVNPNNVKISVDCVMETKGTKSLGVFANNKFVLAQFKTGSKNVAGASITDKYIGYTKATLSSYLDMRKVLSDAGFTFDDKPDSLDLTNLSKDTLIELLS